MSKDILYFSKVKPNAIVPSKREEDSGYDFYPCLDQEYILIEPNETKLIGLGVATAFPSNYVMFLKERSSTGAAGLSLRAGVIDSGYRGEYMAAITNVNSYPVAVIKDSTKDPIGIHIPNYPKGICNNPNEAENLAPYCFPVNKAICQGVLLEIPQLEVQEIPYDELLEMESERGTGLMGSSGK